MSEPPEKEEREEDTSLKSPLLRKKRHMFSHGKSLMFNVFCVFLKYFRKGVIEQALKIEKIRGREMTKVGRSILEKKEN